MPANLAIRAAFAIMLCLSGTASNAFDIDSMTDAERDSFRGEVRAYLLDNPEVLMEAIKVLEDRQASAQTSADKSLVQNLSGEIYEDGRSWVGGNPDGDVTLVEFLDYRCGYCRKAHDDVAELVSGDGNIRFIVKEFPILGEDSLTSSRFAIATRRIEGAETYARVNDALIKLGGTVNQAALRRIAGDLDIDMDKVVSEMKSSAVTEELTANHALAQKLQITGTPTFIIGGEVVRGYVPLDAMQSIVKEARADN